IAVLTAGGAYVPLDPNYPSERLDFVCRDAQISLLLTTEELLKRLAPEDTRVVLIDRQWHEIEAETDENPAVEVSADNLVYVTYTSGSTGRPKGVMALHR